MHETVLRSNLTKALEEGLAKTGWSKNELSRRAGVSESSVKNILSGKSEHPRIITVSKIAAALEKTVGEFIGESAHQLGPNCERLLQAFHQMTPENRNRLIEVAAAWAIPSVIPPGTEIEVTSGIGNVVYRGPERRSPMPEIAYTGPERRGSAVVRRLS